MKTDENGKPELRDAEGRVFSYQFTISIIKHEKRP